MVNAMKRWRIYGGGSVADRFLEGRCLNLERTVGFVPDPTGDKGRRQVWRDKAPGDRNNCSRVSRKDVKRVENFPPTIKPVRPRTES
jgi:hypothetical protein